MPSGSVVRPAKWSNVSQLYDDGEYSVIWGRYESSSSMSVGARWNGGPDEPGFPNQGAHSTWHVEPDFLTDSILHRLIDQVIAVPSNGDLDAIMSALREFRQRSGQTS